MRITSADLVKFENEYFARNSKYHNQRYGQALCNTFSIQDSRLFYEPDTEQARLTAWNLTKQEDNRQ